MYTQWSAHLSSLFVALLFYTTQACAQGIPVYDNAGYLQWLQQAAAMANDLQQQMKMVKSQTQGIASSLNGDQTDAVQQGLNVLQQGGAKVMSGGSGQVSSIIDSAYGVNVNDTPTPGSNTTMQQTTKDTIRGATFHSAKQQDSLNSEAQRLNDLASQSQAATGTLEAQQAGNQINVEVAQQIQKMRAQQLAQDQANNAALLQKQKEQESQQAINAVVFGTKQQ